MYALICGIVFVAGFPISVFVVLFSRRHKLFGAGTDPFVVLTRARYGFLYEAYGPTAWWWEVEELVRKLLLSAVVLLIEPASPLQVCPFYHSLTQAPTHCVRTLSVATASGTLNFQVRLRQMGNN